MAEGFGKKILNDYQISSAGTLPEKINPNAISSMKEIGIDISANKSKKIDTYKLEEFDLVITLCGDARDKCPIINNNKHIHWDIPDPAKCKESKNKIKLTFSKVRDMIYNHIILLEEKLNK